MLLKSTALACVLVVQMAPPPSASPGLLEATRWYTGVAGRVDDARARALLEKADAEGEPLARMWVARCLSRGRMGMVRDEARARALAATVISEVRRSAEAGELEAVFLMGTAYDEGLGAVEDPATAAVWFRRAAERGHVLAQHNLGNAYAAGRGIEQHDGLAVEWWLKAARQGDAIPQLRLGEAYEHGRGVARDLGEARRWYRDAASRGNAAAKAALDRLSAPAGLPRFDRTLLLEKTSETSANVSIGDLNGDGHLDIVLAKGRHWPLVNRVLLGDGRGGFAAGRDLGTAADRSYSASLVDLDADGDLDVVIGNDAPDPKLVYLNDGNGVFDVGSRYGRPEWPMRNGRVTDLNGDGLPDIVVANRSGERPGQNYVCLNRGGGRFEADCTAFSSESATTITAADFNRDGSVDLAVPHRDGGQSRVYLNDGQAGFARSVTFGPPDAAIRMSEAADLDGDGLTDLVAIDERRGGVIFFRQKDGGFSDGVPLGTTKLVPYALAVADMNRDGAVDVIVGHVEAASVIYFNDGSGWRFTPREVGDARGTAYGFAIADLDADGFPDLAVARSGAPNVVYFGSPASGPGRADAPPAR